MEGLVSKLASSLVVLHDFVVEDREVEGEAELDRVAGRKRDLVCLLVGLEGILLDGLELVTLGVLSDVAADARLQLREQDQGLRGKVDLQELGEHLQLPLADVVQVVLKALLVLF